MPTALGPPLSAVVTITMASSTRFRAAFTFAGDKRSAAFHLAVMFATAPGLNGVRESSTSPASSRYRMETRPTALWSCVAMSSPSAGLLSILIEVIMPRSALKAEFKAGEMPWLDGEKEGTTGETSKSTLLRAQRTWFLRRKM